MQSQKTKIYGLFTRYFSSPPALTVIVLVIILFTIVAVKASRQTPPPPLPPATENTEAPEPSPVPALPVSEDASSTATETVPAGQITPYLSISKIARRSPSAVDRLLGEPSSVTREPWRWYGTNTIVEGEARKYNDDVVDVFFLEGKAARIAISLPVSGFFTGDEISKNLAYIDLTPNRKPKIATPDRLEYYNTNGLYRVLVVQTVGEESGTVEVVTDKKYR